MYAFLARFSNRFKWWILVFWVALAAVLFLMAPKLADVGVTDQSQFLPQNTESSTADALLSQKFASSVQPPPSSALIVVYDASGLTSTELSQAQQLRAWLASSSAPSVITSVVSPFDAEILKSKLISQDNTTLLISVDFSVSALEPSVTDAIGAIRGYIHQNFESTQIYVSGDAGILIDLFGSVQQTIGRTTLVTIILVTILLLIVYRSPVAALLPLVTIGVSYLVSSGVLGYLAEAGMKVSTLAEAYLVVIIFGVGTDYCLFLVSRFREEMGHSDQSDARQTAIRQIGPVIAASALTVVVAFLALGFSRFGMNQTTGYAMALGVAITLIAGLTLTPALMSIFGRFVFWPAHGQKHIATPRRYGWQAVGRWVSAHPVWTAVPLVVLLALPYTALSRISLSASVSSQMPSSAESVQGFNIFAGHFPGGEFSPMYLMIQLPPGQVFEGDNLAAVQNVAVALAKVTGISNVDYYNAPAGNLSQLAGGVASIESQLSQGQLPDASSLAVIQSAGTLIQSLPLQYPGIVQSQNYMQAAASLPQIQTLLAQLSAASQSDLPSLLAQLPTSLASLSASLNGLADEFNLNVSSAFTASLLAAYFSTDRTVARVNIELAGDPYAPATTSTVTSLREQTEDAIQSSSIAGAKSYLGGEAPSRADILAINSSDFGRVTVLTVIGVLVVIALLLRSVLAPLYMVLTVLFNYGATLGICVWLFMDLMHKDSLIYLIPLFVFVILVALGADYNIFLMSRIREESHKYTVRESVARAVGGTGGVITACGIILAGTFATLTTSSLQVVLEIGAAIAIGIIVDTFLVRALLVPAIAVMVGRAGWWPSKLFYELRARGDKETRARPPE
jgi:putative drug exporter of the RND superfamily